MCRFIRQTWGCLGETGPGCCDPVGTGSHWRAAGLATEGSYQRCKHRVRPRCQAHAGQSPLPRRVGGSCMHVLAVATGTVSPATPRGSQCPGHEQGSRWQGLAADSRGDAGGGGVPCPLSRAASCGPGAAPCSAGARASTHQAPMAFQQATRRQVSSWGRHTSAPFPGLCRGL